MSEQSRKVKNPLLTAAGQGFPFEGYSTNALLMPVTPATPAILPDGKFRRCGALWAGQLFDALAAEVCWCLSFRLEKKKTCAIFDFLPNFVSSRGFHDSSGYRIIGLEVSQCRHLYRRDNTAAERCGSVEHDGASILRVE